MQYAGPNQTGYLTHNAHTGTGADPWAFWWDFAYMHCGDNDDYSGLDSWAALSGPHPGSRDTNHLNCMIFTGYNSTGTADWIYSN